MITGRQRIGASVAFGGRSNNPDEEEVGIGESGEEPSEGKVTKICRAIGDEAVETVIEARERRKTPRCDFDCGNQLKHDVDEMGISEFAF
ncbi:hypothetical protein DY000_02001299 [Brassica cretica]|uniref:Uncharacterized protein n=1 Tax=Brassica cretica TaxID=69181 RepID=A0ABQ7C129_BRACR|nr:hypothetical protein DY000_02001299 [Brassica cretica]